MALRTSSSTRGASAISPFRTPRDRDWPTPIRLSAPAEFTSPTTAQILEVPISSPTINEAGSNILFPGVLQVFRFGENRRHGSRLSPTGRNIIGHVEIERGDGLIQLLELLVNFPPTAQLTVQVLNGKSHFTSLSRRHLQDVRR